MIKLKVLFISAALSILFFFSFGYSNTYRIAPKEWHTDDGDTIFWKNDIKLKITDFLSNAGCNGEQAKSAVGFIKRLRLHQDTLFIEAYSYFNRKESCNTLTDRSLNDSLVIKMLMEHEKGHFSISEIYIRKFKKILIGLNLCRADAFKRADSVYRDITTKWNAYDDLYDKETVHGSDYKEQREWTKNINMMIKGLENYKATFFTKKLISK